MSQRDGLQFSEGIDISLGKSKIWQPPKPNFDDLKFSGEFPKIEHWRDGELLAIYDMMNAVTALGRGAILDTFFNGLTQIAQASWYISLIDQAGFSALSSADLMGSHAGWVEFTAFVQSTRVLWGQGNSSSQSVTNASPATFDINGTGTLNGIFVTSGSAKGGTAGTLWSAASFSASVPVTSGDQLKITYTISD